MRHTPEEAAGDIEVILVPFTEQAVEHRDKAVLIDNGVDIIEG